MVRKISWRADNERRDRCIYEGVEVLRSKESAPAGRSAGSTKKVVDFLLDNNLRLLQADKEGGFVIATEKEFSRKGLDAVIKNFRVESAVLPKKVKPAI